MPSLRPRAGGAQEYKQGPWPSISSLGRGTKDFLRRIRTTGRQGKGPRTLYCARSLFLRSPGPSWEVIFSSYITIYNDISSMAALQLIGFSKLIVEGQQSRFLSLVTFWNHKTLNLQSIWIHVLFRGCLANSLIVFLNKSKLVQNCERCRRSTSSTVKQSNACCLHGHENPILNNEPCGQEKACGNFTYNWVKEH